MRTCFSRLLALCVVLVLIAPERVHAKDVNFLELAAVLARDGNFDKAADALRQVPEADIKADPIQYHTVQGLVALNTQQPEAAVTAFEAAIAAGQTDPLIYLTLAQAQFGLNRYPQVLATLDRAGAAFEAMPAVALLRAQCEWLDGRRDAALATLVAAQQRFPDQPQFLRRQVAFLMELGLYQAAAEAGRSYLARSDGKEEDFLAIGTALKRSKQYPEAIRLLEIARLRFPHSLNVGKVLAATHLEAGQPLAAAMLMESLIPAEPALVAETAELYRRAGRAFQALSLNARIADQPTKLRQRLGILLELERHAEVRGMQDALQRTGLLDDEDVRYALAYAHFKGGDFATTETLLGPLRRPDLFRKATELRKRMAECAEERWTCV